MNLTLKGAQLLARTEWPQYRSYVRGNELIVRDEDDNVVTIYKFVGADYKFTI